MKTDNILSIILENKELKKQLDECFYIICVKELYNKELINDNDYQILLNEVKIT